MSYGNTTIKDLEITIAEANARLKMAMKEDSDFLYGYQANIAMSFKDAYDRRVKSKGNAVLNRTEVHQVANQAAIYFLNVWLKADFKVRK